MLNTTIIPVKQQVFYRSLVEWPLFDELVFLTHPTQHTETREKIITILDHLVIEHILEMLDETHHESFLDECRQRYHDEALLEWLEDKIVDDFRLRLRQVLRSSKADLKQLLLGEKGLEDIL